MTIRDQTQADEVERQRIASRVEDVESSVGELAEALCDTSDATLGLAELAQFAYKLSEFEQFGDDVIDVHEARKAITLAADARLVQMHPNEIESAIESIDLSLGNAPNRAFVQPIVEKAKARLSDATREQMLRAFDTHMRVGEIGHARRIFVEPGFPVDERRNFVTATLEPKIAPDHFRAIVHIMDRYSDKPAGKLVQQLVCDADLSTADISVRERVRRICEKT